MTKYLLFACIGCTQVPYVDNAYKNVTDYYINPQKVTPKGIAVDDSGQNVNLELIDQLTDEVESCLEIPIYRKYFTVKVPDNWYNGCRNEHWQLCEGEGCGEQLFPCDVPESLCEAKGFYEDCPCSCRAIVQDQNVIVTAPNLHMYSSELIRMVTGVNYIWARPDLSRCYIK